MALKEAKETWAVCIVRGCACGDGRPDRAGQRTLMQVMFDWLKMTHPIGVLSNLRQRLGSHRKKKASKSLTHCDVVAQKIKIKATVSFGRIC
eukprot:scaffold426_cov219-Amphora_coffeaeformis.AAC.21